MGKTTGHIIRISGLVIEMLGIWGVYSVSVNTGQRRIQLPGGPAISIAWIAVALGFALWLTGTILVYAGRPRRKRFQKVERELAP
jgi:hypothetical protein